MGKSVRLIHIHKIRPCSFSALLIALLVCGSAAAQWVWTPETGRFVNLNRLPKETAELQIEFARSLMLQGKHKEALKETGKFKDFYDDALEADENQFLRGDIKTAQKDYVDAAREYQQVVSNYPESALYDEVIAAQYAIGDTLFDKGMDNALRHENRNWFERPFHLFWRRPFRRAIEVYNLVKTNQPFTPEAAEAQYKIGLCYFTLEEYIDADIEYRLVLERYPDSDFVDDASYGRIKVFEGSAQDPEYDQGPSLLAIDAIDDFRARYPDDERSGELDDLRARMAGNVAEQKIQIAEFYERRQLFSSARLYYQLVAEQSPGTPAAGTAREWLEAHPTEQSGLGRFLGPSFR